MGVDPTGYAPGTKARTMYKQVHSRVAGLADESGYRCLNLQV